MKKAIDEIMNRSLEHSKLDMPDWSDHWKYYRNKAVKSSSKIVPIDPERDLRITEFIRADERRVVVGEVLDAIKKCTDRERLQLVNIVDLRSEVYKIGSKYVQ